MILASLSIIVPFVAALCLFGVRIILDSDLKYLSVVMFAAPGVVPLLLFGNRHFHVGDDPARGRPKYTDIPPNGVLYNSVDLCKICSAERFKRCP
jgi:hypothetical protein